jgi:hypothetical protein
VRLNVVESVGAADTPPLALAMKALLGAGFTKWICQNLVFKELRYQNLDNKREPQIEPWLAMLPPNGLSATQIKNDRTPG